MDEDIDWDYAIECSRCGILADPTEWTVSDEPSELDIEIRAGEEGWSKLGYQEWLCPDCV